MAGQASRQLQDLLEAAENLRPNDGPTPATTNSESDHMDYEPATEEESEDNANEAYLERLLAEGHIEEDEGDEGKWHFHQ